MTNQLSTEELRCGFCAKAHKDVKQLIMGWKGAICEECIAMCLAILATKDRALFDAAIESARTQADELTKSN